MSYPKLKLLVAGRWKECDGEPVFNPADETLLAVLPHAGTADLDDAVESAEAALRQWRRESPAKRSAVLLRAAALLRERVESIAIALTLEQGKPLSESRQEVLRACDIIEWDANEGRRLYGRVIPAEYGMQHTVLRQSVGVVAAFSPWNFPISSPARKVAGALAAGCTVVLKASEETPAGALHLATAFIDAGLPAGALNLVFGDPAAISSKLISMPQVRLLTFTGSVPVGKHLAALAAQAMKPAIMELGGHCPVVICEDADPAAAAAACLKAKVRNAGQVCVAPTRFFVHEHVYDAFCDSMASQAAQIKIGDGLKAQTEMGPLINSRRLASIESLTDDALSLGARLLAGGHRIGHRGHFFPLTVLGDVPAAARAMREEPFGPLALICPYRDLDDAIDRSNSVSFGLAAYAFTQSAKYVYELGARLECGNLSINHMTASLPETPFGGVKDSGYGREGGIEGLECYTVVKSISHRL